jgi:hypothetical protein
VLVLAEQRSGAACDLLQDLSLARHAQLCHHAFRSDQIPDFQRDPVVLAARKLTEGAPGVSSKRGAIEQRITRD